MRRFAVALLVPSLVIASGCTSLLGDFSLTSADGGTAESGGTLDATSDGDNVTTQPDAGDDAEDANPGSTEGGGADAGQDAADANPCQNVPVPTISGALAFCPGGSTTLTTDNATGNVWSNNATGQSIIVTQPGTYSVTYTSPQNCMVTSQPVTVTEYTAPPTPTITPSATSVCPNWTVTLTTSATSGNTWSNGGSGQTINVGPGTYTVSTTDAQGCTSAVSAPVTISAITVQHGTVGPLSCGAVHNITVPQCITSVSISMAGAQGGNGGAGGLGGYGGKVQATIPVSPGDVLKVTAGCAGQEATSASSNAGGFNGGGTAALGASGGTDSDCSGTGGGATTVYDNSTLVLVAGGGGGAGCDQGGSNDNGGAGGGQVGAPGVYPYGSGQGGTQAAGGSGGVYVPSPPNPPCTDANPAGAGSYLQGGGAGGAQGSATQACYGATTQCTPTTPYTANAGGGGGGGYYGGGAGCWQGGGGGSDYIEPSATNVSESQGVQPGSGTCSITY